MFSRSKRSEIQSELDAIQDQLGQILAQVTSPQDLASVPNQVSTQCRDQTPRRDQTRSVEVPSTVGQPAESVDAPIANTMSPMDRLSALLAKTNGAEVTS